MCRSLVFSRTSLVKRTEALATSFAWAPEQMAMEAPATARLLMKARVLTLIMANGRSVQAGFGAFRFVRLETEVEKPSGIEPSPAVVVKVDSWTTNPT